MNLVRLVISSCLIVVTICLLAQLSITALLVEEQTSIWAPLAKTGPTTITLFGLASSSSANVSVTTVMIRQDAERQTITQTIWTMSTAENPQSALLQVASLTTALLGVAGLFFGILQYRQAQKLKRQQILFELIREYDQSEEQRFAKLILDDFYVAKDLKGLKTHLGDWKEAYYRVDDLGRILRDHRPGWIDDSGEIAIRDSFDALLEFFGKLEYLLEVGLIKENEILYFDYFLQKTLDNKDVLNYAELYHFRLYQKLLRRYMSGRS